MNDRLTVAQINLSHFKYNLSHVKKLLRPHTLLCAIVKANAYGHGSLPIALEAQKNDVDYFGVVCLYEARILREGGIHKPILILNYTDPESINESVKLNLTLNVMDEPVLKALDKAARSSHMLAKIHVKIDTGMHRLGLSPNDGLSFIQKVENYKNIQLEGIFSHFATSDERDLDFAYSQLSLFNDFIKKLNSKKIYPKILHIANSAGCLRIKGSHLDMVRPGIILYGMAPSNEFNLPFQPKPILTLKTIVTQVRKIKSDESVGYGRTFVASKDTVVATLAVGYADGFRRAPNNFGKVLINGEFAPILGRVSMDQTSIDVTHISNVKIGDEVTLIGKQGKNEITADDVAKSFGTINYEVTTSLSARVTRIYTQG